MKAILTIKPPWHPTRACAAVPTSCRSRCTAQAACYVHVEPLPCYHVVGVGAAAGGFAELLTRAAQDCRERTPSTYINTFKKNVSKTRRDYRLMFSRHHHGAQPPTSRTSNAQPHSFQSGRSPAARQRERLAYLLSFMLRDIQRAPIGGDVVRQSTSVHDNQAKGTRIFES